MAVAVEGEGEREVVVVGARDLVADGLLIV